jgi:hypothetical protein
MRLLLLHVEGNEAVRVVAEPLRDAVADLSNARDLFLDLVKGPLSVGPHRFLPRAPEV